MLFKVTTRVQGTSYVRASGLASLVEWMKRYRASLDQGDTIEVVALYDTDADAPTKPQEGSC